MHKTSVMLINPQIDLIIDTLYYHRHLNACTYACTHTHVQDKYACMYVSAYIHTVGTNKFYLTAALCMVTNYIH